MDQLYEIHLTIHNNHKESEFIALCKELNIKPIILDLDGETQITTSATIQAPYPLIAKLQSKSLAKKFMNNGFAVIRVKLETVPDNSYIDELIGDNEKSYYETHFSFLTDKNERDNVTKYCKLYGVHVSKNTLKHDGPDKVHYMGTVRDGIEYDVHKTRIETITQYLNNNNIYPRKIITEFVFFDSNKELDNNWIK